MDNDVNTNIELNPSKSTGDVLANKGNEEERGKHFVRIHQH